MAKKKTPLERIGKLLEKLEALHEKENDIVEQINRIRAPFNVNSLAQVAAIAAITDDEFLARAVAINREGKAWLTGELTTRSLGVTRARPTSCSSTSTPRPSPSSRR